MCMWVMMYVCGHACIMEIKIQPGGWFFSLIMGNLRMELEPSSSAAKAFTY